VVLPESVNFNDSGKSKFAIKKLLKYFNTTQIAAFSTSLHSWNIRDSSLACQQWGATEQWQVFLAFLF